MTRISNPTSPTTPALAEAEANKRRTDGKEPRRSMNTVFRTFANGTARVVGSPWSFLVALLLIVLWACSYRLFVPTGADPDHWKSGFDSWQIVINTLTTIITFLMVFLIQNTQNRDAKAIHLKLDELIRAVEGARTRLVDLQNLTDEELDRLEREFKRIHEREQRKADNAASPDVNGRPAERRARGGTSPLAPIPRRGGRGEDEEICPRIATNQARIKTGWKRDTALAPILSLRLLVVFIHR